MTGDTGTRAERNGEEGVSPWSFSIPPTVLQNTRFTRLVVKFSSFWA